MPRHELFLTAALEAYGVVSSMTYASCCGQSTNKAVYNDEQDKQLASPSESRNSIQDPGYDGLQSSKLKTEPKNKDISQRQLS